MGNDLNVLYKGKNIGSLGRKHNYVFYGNSNLPDEDECNSNLDDSRKHVVSTIVGYASWLAAQDKDIPLTFHMDDIVTSIKDLLEYFEYEVNIASKNHVLRELTLQLDEDGNLSNEVIEVVDDMEVDRREKLKNMFVDGKKKYFEDLRIRVGVTKDDLEGQTGMVELGDDIGCDDINAHAESIEDIGYCSYCRKLQNEEDEYLDRQNRN